jgi:hypothetical protein
MERFSGRERTIGFRYDRIAFEVQNHVEFMTEDDTFSALKNRREVNKEGTISYYNTHEQLHREDGPAVIHVSGLQEWWVNGERHNEDGPAVIYADGTQEWFLNGQLHREDGPAIVRANGAQAWFLNGKRHREDGPAVICADGAQAWYQSGELIK